MRPKILLCVLRSIYGERKIQNCAYLTTPNSFGRESDSPCMVSVLTVTRKFEGRFASFPFDVANGNKTQAHRTQLCDVTEQSILLDIRTIHDRLFIVLCSE